MLMTCTQLYVWPKYVRVQYSYEHALCFELGVSVVVSGMKRILNLVSPGSAHGTQILGSERLCSQLSPVHPAF